MLSGFFRDADAVRPRLKPNDKRPVFVAHGTNDGVVAIDGGRATKAFLEDAAKLGIDMSPLDGGGILKMLDRMAATPKDVIARYNAISGEKK